jgi:hypothetical protein
MGFLDLICVTRQSYLWKIFCFVIGFCFDATNLFIFSRSTIRSSPSDGASHSVSSIQKGQGGLQYFLHPRIMSSRQRLRTTDDKRPSPPFTHLLPGTPMKRKKRVSFSPREQPSSKPPKSDPFPSSTEPILVQNHPMVIPSVLPDVRVIVTLSACEQDFNAQ